MIPRWGWGLALGLLGSVAINLGNNIQSLGLLTLQNGERRDAERVNGCKSWTWICGTVIFVTGSLLNFASYGFAAQSLLAALEAVQFLTNMAFSRLVFGKRINCQMMIGTLLVIAGTLLVVLFNSHSSEDFSSHQMLRLYTNLPYQIYLAAIILLSAACIIVHGRYEAAEKGGRELPWSDVVMPVTYTCFSAIWGTQSVVQAKCLAELLTRYTSNEEQVFASPFTYAVMVAWVVTVMIWLTRMNTALSRYDPSTIIPLLQCEFIFFAIVSGGIFFLEFNSFTTLHWVGFTCGLGIMFAGLLVLTLGSINERPSKTEGSVQEDASREGQGSAALDVPLIGDDFPCRQGDDELV